MDDRKLPPAVEHRKDLVESPALSSKKKKNTSKDGHKSKHDGEKGHKSGKKKKNLNEEPTTPAPESAKATASKDKKNILVDGQADLDFWLSTSNGTTQDKSPVHHPPAEASNGGTNSQKAESKEKKKKKKDKDKGSKEEDDKDKKKSKKEKSRKESNNSQLVTVSTPIKETVTPVNPWNLLAENKQLRMVFSPEKEEVSPEFRLHAFLSRLQKCRATLVPHDQQQVLITFQLINRRSGVIKSINFNVIDSSSARMLRGAHEQDGVQLPFEIAGKAQIEVPLAFAVEDSHASHQLRGVVTFMAQVGVDCNECFGLLGG